MLVPLITLVAAWWSDRQHSDASPLVSDQMGALPAALGGRDLAGDDRISLEMGRRQPLGESFGVLPLVAAGLVAEGAAVAGGAQVIAFPGAAVAGAGALEVGIPMALLIMGDVARRYYEAASVVQASDWGRSSPRWREAAAEISRLAAKSGYDLDPSALGSSPLRRVLSAMLRSQRTSSEAAERAAVEMPSQGSSTTPGPRPASP